MHWLTRTTVIAIGFLAASCRTDAPALTKASSEATAMAPATKISVTSQATAAASLAGESPIADNFDVAASLVTAGETPTVAPDPTGAFRFLCGAGQLLKDDPLVYPGQPGAAHLHQFFGNTGANAHSNYASLRTTGGTTCGESAAPVQRSSYWIPAMLDGIGNAVKPDFMLTYYKALPASNPACGAPDATHVGICIPLPNGLRFIFGYDMRTMTGGPTDVNSPDYWAFAFECTDKGGGALGGRYRTIAAVVAEGKCPLDTGYLRVAAAIPQCWDGRNLDTADHRSHMAYATTGGVEGIGRACPDTHPYKIPEIANSFFFKVDAAFLQGKWRLSSDEMHAGTTPGTTMHMDYWEAWSPTVKAAWQANCIDRHLSCNLGNLGNGQQIKGMQMPAGGWPVGVKVALSSLGITAPAPTAPAPAPTPSTTTCPDGSTVLIGLTCPVTNVTTKVCPDGRVIPSTKKCPPGRKTVMRVIEVTSPVLDNPDPVRTVEGVSHNTHNMGELGVQNKTR